MKNIFLLSLIFAFSISVFAQEEDFETSSRFGKADRLIFDFYSDIWMGAPDSVNIRGYNPGASISLMQDFALGSSNFSLAIGLGIGTHNFHHNATIFKDTLDYSYFQNRVDTPKMNKLVLSFIDVPIELRFRTKRANVFRFSIGGKIGYMVNNHIKFVSEGLKIKSYNIKDVNPLRYGVTARVGYKMYNLFVYYSLSTLFEKDKGTEMAPLSIGISIIPF